MTVSTKKTFSRASRRGFAMLETILSVAAVSSITTSGIIYAAHAAESAVTKDLRSSFGIVKSELESKWSGRQPIPEGDLISKGSFKDLPGFVYLEHGRVGHKWASAEVSIENIGGGTVRFEINGTNQARCKKIAWALAGMAKFEGFQSVVLVNDKVLVGPGDSGMNAMMDACEDTEFTNSVGMFLGGAADVYAEAAGYQMIGRDKTQPTPKPPSGGGGSAPAQPDPSQVASNGGSNPTPPPVTPVPPSNPTPPTPDVDPDTTAEVAADTGENPAGPVDPSDPVVPVVTPPDPTDPVTPVAPGNGGGKNPNGNNGHGNDADGNDDSNPGKSNDPNDHTDDDGVPGKSGENGNGNPPSGAEETPYGHAKTYVTVMMDQADSKGNARKDKIAALNGWIASLQVGGEDVNFTVIFYDSGATTSSGTGAAVTNTGGFTGGNFGSSGAISFADAATQGMSGNTANGTRSVVAIQADGAIAISDADNAAIKAMIAAREASGWKFNFMGGSSAAAQAGSFGISDDYTVVYGPGGMGQAFRDSAAGTTDYAAGVTEGFVPGGAQ